MVKEKSSIQYINKEIRREKILIFLYRYGIYLVCLLIFIIVSTIIAFHEYFSINKRKAEQLGDDFLLALDVAKKANYDEAFIQLDRIVKSGFAAYPVLARMRQASILAEKGEKENAIKMFDNIAATANIPEIMKNMAKIRAAYLFVDIGSFSSIEQRVKKFATDIDPMRFAARDILGLSAWKYGKVRKAMYYFSKIYEDKEAIGSGFHSRAEIFLSLLQSIGIDK